MAKRTALSLFILLLALGSATAALLCHGPYTVKGKSEVYTNDDGTITVACVENTPGDLGSQCKAGESIVPGGVTFTGETCTFEYNCCKDPAARFSPLSIPGSLELPGKGDAILLFDDSAAYELTIDPEGSLGVQE